MSQLWVHVQEDEPFPSDPRPTHSPVENGQLPDPANWGVADVVNYFKATGFEEQATAFQDQVGVLSPAQISCRAVKTS